MRKDRVRIWVVNNFLFSRKTFNNSSKMARVLKTATTVYERENCDGAMCRLVAPV